MLTHPVNSRLTIYLLCLLQITTIQTQYGVYIEINPSISTVVQQVTMDNKPRDPRPDADGHSRQWKFAENNTARIESLSKELSEVRELLEKTKNMLSEEKKQSNSIQSHLLKEIQQLREQLKTKSKDIENLKKEIEVKSASSLNISSLLSEGKAEEPKPTVQDNTIIQRLVPQMKKLRAHIAALSDKVKEQQRLLALPTNIRSSQDSGLVRRPEMGSSYLGSSMTGSGFSLTPLMRTVGERSYIQDDSNIMDSYHGGAAGFSSSARIPEESSENIYENELYKRNATTPQRFQQQHESGYVTQRPPRVPIPKPRTRTSIKQMTSNSSLDQPDSGTTTPLDSYVLVENAQVNDTLTPGQIVHHKALSTINEQSSPHTRSTASSSSPRIPQYYNHTVAANVNSQPTRLTELTAPVEDMYDEPLRVMRQHPVGGNNYKICDVCNVDFSEMSKPSFERHCLECAEKAGSDSDPGLVNELGGEPKLCPVCNSVFDPLTPQTDFENHVQSHFRDEAPADWTCVGVPK